VYIINFRFFNIDPQTFDVSNSHNNIGIVHQYRYPISYKNAKRGKPHRIETAYFQQQSLYGYWLRKLYRNASSNIEGKIFKSANGILIAFSIPFVGYDENMWISIAYYLFCRQCVSLVKNSNTSERLTQASMIVKPDWKATAP